jgi:hypothetical protein
MVARSDLAGLRIASAYPIGDSTRFAFPLGNAMPSKSETPRFTRAKLLTLGITTTMFAAT